MSNRLHNPSESTLLTAIDRNWRVAMRAFGLAPQVHIRDDDQVFWYITGMADPAFNSIMYAHLAPDQIGGVVQELRSLRETYAVPMNWLVGADSRPSDLGRQLVAAGLRHLVDLPLMTAELVTLHDDQARPAELTIQRVESEQLWAEWIAAELQGFEVESTFAPAMVALRMGMGFGDQLPLAHFLGRLGGQPVATASLLLAEGIAGIYDVSTVPGVRRAGVGAAMMQHALRAAREQGYQHAWLQPSEMAYPFYERLGFRSCGACGIFG
jgi:GNAT superfamily N-acetyltransferase